MECFIRKTLLFFSILVSIYRPRCYHSSHSCPAIVGAIFHDERYFDRPHEFIPERFLQHPLGIKDGIGDDPARRANLMFGSGRRVCPGIVFAKTSMVHTLLSHGNAKLMLPIGIGN